MPNAIQPLLLHPPPRKIHMPGNMKLKLLPHYMQSGYH